jgi:hypothetical protein
VAKAQTSAATSGAKSLIDQANKELPPVIQGFQDQRTQDIQTANRLLGEAESGYQQQQTTGGYDPTQLANLRTELGGMAPTGGYDPEQLAAITGGYGNFAQTGGFTLPQQQTYLRQATAGLGTTESALANAARRSAAATGGDASAAIAQMQGELGGQQAEATNTALANLNAQINANKLAGLGGLGTTEANLAQARQGVAGLQTGLEGGVARGVQAANQGLAGLFNTETGQITAQGQQLLDAMGLKYSTQQGAINALTQLSRNPGLFQTAIGDVAQLGGAAVGAYKGLYG